MALKNNTWKINQWYDQAVAGNVSYTGQRGTLWGVGRNHRGQLGVNVYGPGEQDGYSSPIQIPGTTWHSISGTSGGGGGDHTRIAVKTDGTLWSWGYNENGQLGQNDRTNRSSPTQIGGGTDWAKDNKGLRNTRSGFAIKTDGTLWSWGYGNQGALAQNNNIRYSSPVQIPGTTWSSLGGGQIHGAFATKTDGTLWAWGANQYGVLCQGPSSTPDRRSSPIQIPGSTWDTVKGGYATILATKTDGTLWSWGNNETGEMGINSSGDDRSSPVQIGSDTTWAPGYNKIAMSIPGAFAIKTDGTLWSWGNNTGGVSGYLGLGDSASRSSPTQIPGSWNTVACTDSSTWAIKTDGSLWSWGNGYNGRQGHNNDTQYNSPVQVGSLTNYVEIGTSADSGHFLTQA
jgi:alpha-tubulin suppressor-like RCC1 family protein